jgi:hypothetical protein
MKLIVSLLLIAIASLTACSGGATPTSKQISVLTNQLSLDYAGFKLLYDCDLKSAIRFKYKLDKDTGNFSSPTAFNFDPNLSNNCGQQLSTSRSPSLATAKLAPGTFHLAMNSEMAMSKGSVPGRDLPVLCAWAWIDKSSNRNSHSNLGFNMFKSFVWIVELDFYCLITQWHLTRI